MGKPEILTAYLIYILLTPLGTNDDRDSSCNSFEIAATDNYFYIRFMPLVLIYLCYFSLKYPRNKIFGFKKVTLE